MRIKKKVLVPEHYVEKVDKTVCDFCLKEIKHNEKTPDDKIFYFSLYFNVSQLKTDEVINFDVCFICATERIVPLLKGESVSGADWVTESNE